LADIEWRTCSVDVGFLDFRLGCENIVIGGHVQSTVSTFNKPALRSISDWHVQQTLVTVNVRHPVSFIKN
jgi:hypothetical protein